jgi:hypothetical protein
LSSPIIVVFSREAVRNKLTAAGVEPATRKSSEDFAAFMRAQAAVRQKSARVRRLISKHPPPVLLAHLVRDAGL